MLAFYPDCIHGSRPASMLNAESLSAWSSRLPEDVLGAIAAEGVVLPGDSTSLQAELDAAKPGEAPEIVRRHPDATKALGRAGRLRLMARITGEPDPGPVLRRLVGDDMVEAADTEGGDQSGEGGRDAVGVLFLEDLRALAEHVVGPRIARRMLDGTSMDLATGAAQTLESEITFHRGGI